MNIQRDLPSKVYEMRSIAILAFSLSFAPIAAIGQSIEQRVIENSYSYAPTGSGPFPALIAMPGCSGISTEDSDFEQRNPELQEDDLLFRRHYRTMAHRFRDEGYAVFLIDVHRAESVLTACAGEISSRRLAEYISAAIATVSSQPMIDKRRVYLIGWSMGGRGVLEWLHGPREGEEKLKAAIAVYPGCAEATDLTVNIPILMLLGGADDIADPAKCEELVRVATARDHIHLKTYAAARHGFDIEDAPQVVEIGGGMTVGYQQAAAEASWNEILSFLRGND